MIVKKIMFFVDWFEPGYRAGGPIRSCVNLSERLSEKAEILIVTGNTDYNECEPYPDIQPDTWIKRGGKNVWYASPRKRTWSEFRELLVKEKPDVVYLNSMFSTRYTLIPLLLCLFFLPSARIVLAPRGMLAKGALSVKAGKKKVFLKLFRFLPLKRIMFHATTVSEADDIINAFPKAEVYVAPNLVEDRVSEVPHSRKDPGQLHLVSIARISPEKNLLFLLKCLASVSNNVRLTLYGSINDYEYWNKCSAMIRTLPENISVQHKGPIAPEEISKALKGNDFMILPTLGENFGHVIIESLSAATPVVISDRTPWLDLEQVGCGFVLALEEDAWIKVLRRIAGLSEQDYIHMSMQARNYANEYVQRKNDINSYRFLFE